MVKYWLYLTFTPEAEGNGEAASARTEIYQNVMKKIRAKVKAITVTWAEFVYGCKKLAEMEMQHKLDEWME